MNSKVTALLLFLILACGYGCKSNVGDRCQLDSDCGAGLACVLLQGGNCQTGGACQPVGPGTQPCNSNSDCSMGLVCTQSASCTKMVCTSPADMAIVDQASSSDAQ
jgi:hypothetical protein